MRKMTDEEKDESKDDSEKELLLRNDDPKR